MVFPLTVSNDIEARRKRSDALHVEWPPCPRIGAEVIFFKAMSKTDATEFL
jgi:hypothetical protein